jgi:hypothetical protein
LRPLFNTPFHIGDISATRNPRPTIAASGKTSPRRARGYRGLRKANAPVVCLYAFFHKILL